MRLLSYQAADGPRTAVQLRDDLVDLNQADPRLPRGMRQLLEMGADGRQRVAQLSGNSGRLDPAGVRRLAPVPDPQKVICIGLNYADHAAESGAEIPAEPVVFCKFPTAVAAPGEPIRLPAVSGKVDYEAELVVVIGREGRNIPREQALEYVAGYTCGHDVSARDWQLHKPGGQWLLGKTFDSFAPMGPDLVTPDEVGDPGQLGIRLRLNGQTMQNSSTRQLIFSIDQLIAYISQVCTLCPGDVIFTGTPPGVGAARKPPVYLKPGDLVEVEIDKLGTLSNPVVAAG
ncbi:MAG: fumarylacetoacetate hydrolase family protein [Pirellulaceae bacterium]|nr:fumarylacetoacetate hydrolase family protein [Pirellulaceae bacterium]